MYRGILLYNDKTITTGKDHKMEMNNNNLKTPNTIRKETFKKKFLCNFIFEFFIKRVNYRQVVVLSLMALKL